MKSTKFQENAPEHIVHGDLPRGEAIREPYKSTRTFFAAAVALQFALITGIGIKPLATMAYGRTITLDTVAVDPWEMFRGDYITLRYRCNRINERPGKTFAAGQKVFVVLKQDGSEQWQVVDISDKQPDMTDNKIAIAGKVKDRRDGSINVNYGIEQVFVIAGSCSLN